MKKLFCIFLAIVMLFSMNVIASADSDLETALADVTVETPDFPEAGEKETAERADVAVTTDKVTLTDSSIIVKTADGLYFSYQYPNENVIAISQDLQQQSYLYLVCYSSNMTQTCANFIEKGMHLNIFDIESLTDIYFYTAPSTLSTIVQNLTSLTEADVLVVEQLVKDNYFPDAESVTTGMIGNNLWFFADYGSAGMLVTFVNGIEILGVFQYQTDNGAAVGLSLLDTLTITAA